MPEMDGTPNQPEAVTLEQAASAAYNQEPEVVEESQPSEKMEEATEPETDKGNTPLDEIDPSTLPPELQAVYKNLQKGFTQGRQKDREEVNSLRTELETLRKQLTPEQPETPTDPVEAKVQEILAQRESQSFVQQAQTEYETLDPRLNRQGEQYNEAIDFFVGAKLDQALDKHLEDGKQLTAFDYKKEGKEAIEAFDGLVEKVVESRIASLKSDAQKTLAKTKRLAPESSKAPVKNTDSMSLEEAIRYSFAEKK
jgi:hypothetical protein